MTDQEKVAKAIFRLTYQEKRLIERIYGEGQSADEVAQDMQMTMPEVRKRISRAVQEISQATGIDEKTTEHLVFMYRG